MELHYLIYISKLLVPYSIYNSLHLTVINTQLIHVKPQITNQLPCTKEIYIHK